MSSRISLNYANQKREKKEKVKVTHPYLKFDSFVVSKDCFHLKINTDSRHESGREGVIRIAK